MNEFRDYKKYVADPKWAKQYSDYQQRYKENPRESDKKSARLVMAALWRAQITDRAPRILDIGCHNGNFLRHLKRLMPAADLYGGDLMVPAIEEARADPTLNGINFEVMDVFAIPNDKPFDIIVANAVNVYFDAPEYKAAVQSIANALTPTGTFIAYEWIFPGEREQLVFEKSHGHPEDKGLKFWLRSEIETRAAMESAGFTDTIIEPFDIPIDLPKPVPNGTDDDLATYTIRDERTGRRLMFRGALFQPWAHIVASANGQ